MAVINSDQIANGTPIAGFGAGGGQVRVAHFRVTVPIGTTTTDTIPLVYLPPNAMVIGGSYENAALGAGTLNIGDLGGGLDPDTNVAITASPTRYWSAAAVTSAGVSDSILATGRYFKTGKQKVLVQGVFASGTTTTAGVLEGHLSFIVEEPQ